MLYRGIKLDLIKRNDYHVKKAKRYIINGTNQNIWIPNKHLDSEGNLKRGENIDYVLLYNWKQCTYAGVDLSCIQGNKGWNYKKVRKELSKNINNARKRYEKTGDERYKNNLEYFCAKYDKVRKYEENL